MRIKRVKARNIYSFKNLDLDLTKYNGIVRILGNNLDSGASNGAGKSAILEVITLGIFGKTIRKSNEDSIVNTQFGSGLSVTLLLDKEGVGDIEITRTKRPTSLNFIVNGVNQNKENAPETQKYIEEVLETDYKSFMASVVFGQHSSFSFLDSNPEDKRKIIRNCFNLDDMFGKRSAVKQLRSGYNAEMKTTQVFLNKLLTEREQLGDQIPDEKYSLIELPSLEEILEAEGAIAVWKNEIATSQISLRKAKEKIKKLQESKDAGVFKEDKECPVCKNSYLKCQTHDDLVKITTELKEFQATALANQVDIDFSTDDIKQMTPKYSSAEWAKYNEKNRLIETSQASRDRLTEVTSQIDEYSGRVNELETLIEVMKFWELAFSEKGLIKYVIRNILEYFNSKCNEYISILTSSQFSIEFTDGLEETIKNNGLVTKYISLSGGEKRRVNLAIMLALQDLSAKISRTNCNVIFFDEVCDNIDDSGISAVNNLLDALRLQYPDKVLLLITHNTHLQDLLSESQYILVTKKEGLSTIG
tara:strand:+ start:84634 stop:86226 length:1593 start_codon:yes stop_codon:yes gene_type:complete